MTDNVNIAGEKVSRQVRRAKLREGKAYSTNRFVREAKCIPGNSKAKAWKQNDPSYRKN